MRIQFENENVCPCETKTAFSEKSFFFKIEFKGENCLLNIARGETKPSGHHFIMTAEEPNFRSKFDEIPPVLFNKQRRGCTPAPFGQRLPAGRPCPGLLNISIKLEVWPVLRRTDNLFTSKIPY